MGMCDYGIGLVMGGPGLAAGVSGFSKIESADGVMWRSATGGPRLAARFFGFFKIKSADGVIWWLLKKECDIHGNK